MATQPLMENLKKKMDCAKEIFIEPLHMPQRGVQ
jgi:hypothetical protein